MGRCWNRQRVPFRIPMKDKEAMPFYAARLFFLCRKYAAHNWQSHILSIRLDKMKPDLI